MKDKINSVPIALKEKPINVRLDYRTFITLPSLSALKTWLVRYPDATILHPGGWSLPLTDEAIQAGTNATYGH